TPGGGKSGGITALLSGIARLEHVALIGLDPKRVEQTLWRPRFSRIATEPDDATAVLEALRDEMERRYQWLQEQGLKKIGPGQLTSERPLLVVVIDELADLVSVGSTKEEKAEELKRSTLIRRLIALGRAAGVVVIAATQKPQSDVVPTALRDLIQLRVAYATTNPAMTETILGAGMAQTGGLSHEISAAERGVAYIVTETSRTPRRVRTRWVPDEEVAGIAERYAHLRVELPWMPDESQVQRRSMREGEVITPVAAPTPAPVIEDLGTIDLGLDDLGLDIPAPEPDAVPADDPGEEEFAFDDPAPSARPRDTETSAGEEEFEFDVEEDPAAAWGF
ncbi:MAG TPA: FtsK/SpoIIIE domain-containing protein, partial [Brevibacterium sp.]|nr:FtsK/SpoIIIE domain-containing protein [Brevibacterium sp.]